MSHEATAWAFKMRHLKPATKIVLLTLADCHNPEHGCFPSQTFLAGACEMSERSVRDHLSKLEKLGLITRVHREKTGTKFASDGYELHFDRVLTEPEKPAAKFAGRQNLPAAENDNSQRQNLPPNLVKRTSKRARDAYTRGTELPPRPLPNCWKCIPAGSINEDHWDGWLRKRGYPRLSDLSEATGDGWDAPWAKPPDPDDDLKSALAESWADWHLLRRQSQAA